MLSFILEIFVQFRHKWNWNNNRGRKQNRPWSQNNRCVWSKFSRSGTQPRSNRMRRAHACVNLFPFQSSVVSKFLVAHLPSSVASQTCVSLDTSHPVPGSKQTRHNAHLNTTVALHWFVLFCTRFRSYHTKLFDDIGTVIRVLLSHLVPLI